MILESLATNRGKTLYCAVDQSDTFTKAETWEAGKDRNERDDTVYYGEKGRFRGFLAAQEGYLTDGESGVTGISRERIFEFPEEQRRRVTRVKRLSIEGVAESPWGAASGAYGGLLAGQQGARNLVNGNGNMRTAICGPHGDALLYHGDTRCLDSDMQMWAEADAAEVCTGRGYEKAVNVVTDINAEVWVYVPQPGANNFRAYRARDYTATCTKRVRKTVRSR